MNKDQKEAMFQDLLVFCEEEDVKILIKTILNSHHELEMLEQLKPYLEKLQAQLDSDESTVAG